jgi:hypothetical protein
VNNGVTGDPRPSTPEIGKRLFDMRVAYAGGGNSAADSKQALKYISIHTITKLL